MRYTVYFLNFLISQTNPTPKHRITAMFSMVLAAYPESVVLLGVDHDW